MYNYTIANKLRKVIKLMHQYQKNHNIKSECIVNAKYLYDKIKSSQIGRMPIKVMAVICVSRAERPVVTSGHLVLSYNNDINEIIDPSYEVYSFKNKEYYATIEDFMNNMPPYIDSIAEYVIKKHIKFLDIAKKINEGSLMIHDYEYYNQQADYVYRLL
tara:strand:- start:30053 stop:30529 length:477 start_codon:yes stop_codon:yes gene_type:complete